MKLKDYEGKCGMCTKCKEWTDVTEPCCNASVYYEGSYISLDDFDDQLTDEYDEMTG